jgi:hypothetical protein
MDRGSSKDEFEVAKVVGSIKIIVIIRKLPEAREKPTIGLWCAGPIRPTPSSSIRRPQQLGVVDLTTHLARPRRPDWGEEAAAPKPYCALELLRCRLSDPGEISRSPVMCVDDLCSCV